MSLVFLSVDLLLEQFSIQIFFVYKEKTNSTLTLKTYWSAFSILSCWIIVLQKFFIFNEYLCSIYWVQTWVCIEHNNAFSEFDHMQICCKFKRIIICGSFYTEKMHWNRLNQNLLKYMTQCYEKKHRFAKKN